MQQEEVEERRGHGGVEEGISIYMIEISFPSREREQERERESYSLSSLFLYIFYFMYFLVIKNYFLVFSFLLIPKKHPKKS